MNLETHSVKPGGFGKPVALRLSMTGRCQFRCLYCRPGNENYSVLTEKMLGVSELVRFVGLVQRSFGVSKLRLTGGEPLLRPDLAEVVEALSMLGVGDLALTTNGQCLCQFATTLKRAGLKRVNISLDSLRPPVFRTLAGAGDLNLTLQGIDAALGAGLSPVRLNTVVLRGINDDEVGKLLTFSLDRGCELRFIELMPTGLSLADYQRYHLPTAELLLRLTTHFQLTPLLYEAACSARRYAVLDEAGRSGVVGFISPINHPFCANCRRLRLTAGGELIGCLARPERCSIAELLLQSEHSEEATDALVQAMECALMRKRTGEQFTPVGLMSAVGG